MLRRSSDVKCALGGIKIALARADHAQEWIYPRCPNQPNSQNLPCKMAAGQGPRQTKRSSVEPRSSVSKSLDVSVRVNAHPTIWSGDAIDGGTRNLGRAGLILDSQQDHRTPHDFISMVRSWRVRPRVSIPRVRRNRKRARGRHRCQVLEMMGPEITVPRRGILRTW